MSDILTWIEQTLSPRTCTTDELWYDHMDSHSGRSLPILYQPFDVNEARHWADRGWILDFLSATGSGRVLDLGPGDGWPLLILAPHVQEVVGVEGRTAASRSAGRTRSGWGSATRAFYTSRPARPCLLQMAALTGSLLLHRSSRRPITMPRCASCTASCAPAASCGSATRH